jgi:type III secretion protein N (ATPase)
VDTALTCGEGQRLGIFAAAGVGKSTLLAQMMRSTQAEVTVLALIGERGREVRDFIERDLGSAGLQHSVVVVATSDRPAMERVTAAFAATAIAEAFRDAGKRVLLLMDSLTRFARARREVGLAAGEPPVRQGFTPSVFATLPRLVERAGATERGSITALYTVLVEGEEAEDPIAEEVKSLLDGHIVLSTRLAERGHFPAIDVLKSVSRCQPALLSESQRALVRRLRRLLADYEAVELLVKVGDYQAGSQPEADEALAHIDRIRAFLQQPFEERSTPEEAWSTLMEVLA